MYFTDYAGDKEVIEGLNVGLDGIVNISFEF